MATDAMASAGVFRVSVRSRKFGIPAKGENSARLVLTGMVFFGFLASGFVEHIITVALTEPEQNLNVRSIRADLVGMENVTKARRYCDPPNMTALAMYYDSSEEIDNDVNYDFSQLQEMHFQVALSTEETMESILKKAYLWGCVVSPLPSSRLAANIGPKRVFGYALLGTSAATVLVPAAWKTPAHMVIRFFQGIFYGAILPSAHMLAVNWFPARLRSSFVVWYSGKYVGYAISELLTIQVMKSVGHDSIFYIASVAIVIWFIAWSIFVFNTPEKHPKLSNDSKKRLKCDLQETRAVPWKNLLTSVPMWMSVGVIFGAHCGQATVEIAIRQYLKFVYNITEGRWCAFPFLLHWNFAVLCGFLVDFIRKKRIVSTTSSRRMFVYVSHFIPAAMIFVVSFAGCESTAPIVLFSMSVIMNGATYAGAFSSALDIAPNFAGTIFGLCCTFGAVGSIAVSYITSQILNGQILGSWRLTFSLTSLILLLSSIFFMLRGSGAVQVWNDQPRNETTVHLSQQPKGFSVAPASSAKFKHKLSMEKKILKVLYVQEPERFIRARAYSTNSPDYRRTTSKAMVSSGNCDKKRASIS